MARSKTPTKSNWANTGTDNTILQGTFNMDLSERARIAFGGMYHDYKSNQVAGWNRLTQALIDDGTYTTGLAMPLDGDGDGAISHQEFNAANDGGGLFSFTFNPAGVTGPVTFGPDFALDPATVGVAKLDGNQVLVAGDRKNNRLKCESWNVDLMGDGSWRCGRGRRP